MDNRTAPTDRSPYTVKASLWSYDVWGNEDDGFEVNDRCCLDRSLDLPELLKANEEAILVAIDASPNCAIDWSLGDENTLELIDKRNDKPLGQIIRSEHV